MGGCARGRVGGWVRERAGGWEWVGVGWVAGWLGKVGGSVRVCVCVCVCLCV